MDTLQKKMSVLYPPTSNCRKYRPSVRGKYIYKLVGLDTFFRDLFLDAEKDIQKQLLEPETDNLCQVLDVTTGQDDCSPPSLPALC